MERNKLSKTEHARYGPLVLSTTTVVKMSVNLDTVGYIISACFMRLSNPVLYKQNYILVKIAFLLNKYMGPRAGIRRGRDK